MTSAQWQLHNQDNCRIKLTLSSGEWSRSSSAGHSNRIRAIRAIAVEWNEVQGRQLRFVSAGFRFLSRIIAINIAVLAVL